MIKYYFYLIILLILHELGHYLALKFFRIKLLYIVIGNGLYLKIKKLKISPIILSCHIEFSIKEYDSLKLIKKIIIIISGPMMNFLIFLVLPKEYVILRYLSLFIGINSLIPIPCLNTDGLNIMREIIKFKRNV